MADQPAPGAGGGAATGPPLPSSLDAHPGGAAAAPNRMAPSMQRQRPGAGFAQKRAARQAADGGDEDEEKQSRMLEENAKRVKFDESMDVVEPGLDSAVDGPTEEQQRALDADQEMEAEMEAAVQSMPQFTLPSMDEMTEAARHLQVVEAIKRVIAGTEQLQKFIAHKRVVDSTAIGSSTPRALPNGLTTNSGVLEDSMVMLVRLVTNCYIMFGEFCKVRGSAPDMDASSRWKTMHGCVEDILQMIVAAPRERYSLAMILLYELWMSVVITDPELARAPGTPANEYTVFALYLSWCRRIFDAIVGSSMQAATAAAAAAAPPAPVPAPAAGTENGAAAAPAQPPLPAENLILEFFKEAPYIEPALMAKLEVCLKTPATAALGFATLERAIELRPTIFSAGLDMLLTYSVHPDRTTRVGCIRAVRKHYATIKTALKIEKVAAASFNYGVLQADTHSKNAEAEVEAIFRRVEEPVDGGPAPSDEEQLANKSAQALALRQRARQAIDGSLVSHSELLLALSTKNMSLLSHVFDTYRTAPLPVQVAIRQLITPLVKSVAAAPSRIVPVLTQFPKGAETLALRVLFLLCADGQRVPPRELVEPVLRMCDERGLDGNFIVFIMNGMERAEALARLPLLVSILNGTDRPKALVREGFMRLTTPFLGRPSVLSPTELLMGLHNGVTRDNIAKHVEAVGVYESMVRPDGKPMFSTMLFEAALKLLVDQDPVSPLVMQTADIFHRRRGGPAGTVIGLLRRHIEREVWNMDDHVFDAFVGSFHVMLPGTLALVKLLPAEPLKAVVDRSPALRTAIREYVGKMPEPARKQYKWLIDSAPAPAQPNA
ncbi:hypothetical protein H4R19_002697 [Coemansia spiralis]|nr:hypothetical protein H4R19_002697 [Coemansia spiralis]